MVLQSSMTGETFATLPRSIFITKAIELYSCHLQIGIFVAICTYPKKIAALTVLKTNGFVWVCGLKSFHLGILK